MKSSINSIFTIFFAFFGFLAFVGLTMCVVMPFTLDVMPAGAVVVFVSFVSMVLSAMIVQATD